MAEPKKVMSLLGQFSLNENKIAELYSLYAKKFPEQTSLWGGLVKDEKRHAALLAGLDERFSRESNTWHLSENASAILDYIGQYIDDCLRRANEPDFNFKEALNNALSLEQSMLEKKSFEIFSTAIAEIKEVLEKLNRETEGHRLRLLKFLEDRI